MSEPNAVDVDAMRVKLNKYLETRNTPLDDYFWSGDIEDMLAEIVALRNYIELLEAEASIPPRKQKP